MLEGSGKKQNGFFVNEADQVTIDGFTARNYKANGFFVTNAVGYKLTHLVAAKTGVYGVYAFNSKGGEMSHSEAYYVSDAGFYIGQTPQQTKPIRSVVRDVESWGNPIGFSATNMRYVTITKSRFYNNAIGIVPNALESERFPPAEANVITDNDVFWNNFNIHAGAPFKPKKSGVVPLVPVGTGILLLGGRTNRVENNRVYGNYLVGVVAIEGILLDKTTEARALIGNQISGNAFGAGGEDLNGRDLAFDGNGTGNCWGPNTGVQNTLPADSGMFPACPFSGPTRSARTRRPSSSASRAPTRSRAGSTPAQGQARHQAAGGLQEVRPVVSVLAIAGAALVAAPATAAAPKPRTVKIADNYYLPAKLAVRPGTTIKWRWPAEAGDVHDVKLKSGPSGVRKFHSDPASAGYTFKRTLKKTGRYKIVCTLHEEMRMTITVRR